MQVQRYAPALVVLHWLLAILILLSLFMGSVFLQNMPNSDPNKIVALRAHMSMGTLILLLTLLRLVVRVKTTHPAPATTGMTWADKLGQATHWILYLLVILMALSGIAISVQAGLPAIVFQGVGSLPASFDEFAPRAAHGFIALLLMLFIALHIGAALYHQFVKKDHLLARMWFGKRQS